MMSSHILTIGRLRNARQSGAEVHLAVPTDYCQLECCLFRIQEVQKPNSYINCWISTTRFNEVPSIWPDLNTFKMVAKALPFIPWSKTTLLKARKSLESSDVVQEAAVDLFALGYYGHANKLIDSLYQHSHGLDFDVYNSSGTIKALYDAWDTTGKIPTYAANPDPDKIFRGRRLDEKYGKLWESIQNRWTNGLPKEMRDKAKEGNLDTEDFKSAMERMNKDPESSDPDKNLTVGAVVQVAMLTGNEDAAQDLVHKDVADLYRHVKSEWGNSEAKDGAMRKWLSKRLGLHHSNEIWKILKDAQLGKSIGVDEAALDVYIDEGCQLIEQRFTQGPARPHRDKSISELLSIMEEANRSVCLFSAAQSRPSILLTPN